MFSEIKCTMAPSRFLVSPPSVMRLYFFTTKEFWVSGSNRLKKENTQTRARVEILEKHLHSLKNFPAVILTGPKIPITYVKNSIFEHNYTNGYL